MSPIKKILFIVPPNTMPRDSLRRIGEPLGVLYLGAVLKKEGYEVEVYDTTCQGYDNIKEKGGYLTYGSSEEDIKEKVKDAKADLVAVSCMFSARQEDALRVCRYIKEIDKSLPVVIGGLHPSLFPKDMLKSGLIDFVIMGEGEFRLLELVREINRGQSRFNFDGVAYKDKNEAIVNPPAGSISDLNSIPYPDRSLINMEKYIEIGVPYAPYSISKRVSQILATRGCPNRCNFCSTVNFWGRKVRTRSVDNIIGEMKLLKEKYNIEEVQFVDDNLTADKSLAKELFFRMKGLGLKWCTPHGLMFNTIDKEMVRLMAESGAYQLTFAIESASQRVLKEIIHKNVRLDTVKEIVDEAHKYDIGIHGMFLVGFPGETKEEILSTLDFPFKIGFDSVSFFVVNPVPGSDLYDECIEKNYIDGTEIAKVTMDFKAARINIPKDSPEYNYSPKELEQIVDKKTREYNEFVKKTFPERWNKKFQRFLSTHQGYDKTIMGRVT